MSTKWKEALRWIVEWNPILKISKEKRLHFWESEAAIYRWQKSFVKKRKRTARKNRRRIGANGYHLKIRGTLFGAIGR